VRGRGRGDGAGRSGDQIGAVDECGGFSQVTPDLFRFVREGLAERTEFDFVARVRVVPSALSGDGPLIGAAALIHRADLVA
jgi:glucokinase